jgi:hypothetical protein
MTIRRVVVLQPNVPSYRFDFFDRIAAALSDVFIVYASRGELGALSASDLLRAWGIRIGPITSLGPGVQWQRGGYAYQSTGVMS